MIVVDVGCYPHGPEESVYRLCDRFRPDLLFGFDPHPEQREGVEWYEHADLDGWRTTIVLRRRAAWTMACLAGLKVDGDRTALDWDPSKQWETPTINLPAFLDALPDPIVLKLDCEGAEYPILHAVAERNLDLRLGLVLVEWHDSPEPGDYYGHGLASMGKPNLRCPVEEW